MGLQDILFITDWNMYDAWMEGKINNRAGWFKLNSINLVRRKSTPFCRHILNFCLRILRTPVDPLSNDTLFSFFFFVTRLAVCFIFGPYGNPNSRRKKKQHKKIVYRSTGAHETRAQNIRSLSLKNGVDFWTFVQKTCVICVVAS